MTQSDTKTIKCCLPDVGDPQKYWIYDYEIIVFTKISAPSERCYRWTGHYVKRQRCNPTPGQPCGADTTDPGEA